MTAEPSAPATRLPRAAALGRAARSLLELVESSLGLVAGRMERLSEVRADRRGLVEATGIAAVGGVLTVLGVPPQGSWLRALIWQPLFMIGALGISSALLALVLGRIYGTPLPARRIYALAGRLSIVNWLNVARAVIPWLGRLISGVAFIFSPLALTLALQKLCRLKIPFAVLLVAGLMTAWVLVDLLLGDAFRFFA